MHVLTTPIQLMAFTKRSHGHKIPLNSRCQFFCLQKWIELGHVSQVANFWLSSHNFYRSSCNSKISRFQDFQNPMLDDMPLD